MGGTVDRVLTRAGSVTGIITDAGSHLETEAVVLTSGTF